jgi:hypothetical protein
MPPFRLHAKQDDWPAFMGDFGACIGLFQAQHPRAAEGQNEHTIELTTYEL